MKTVCFKAEDWLVDLINYISIKSGKFRSELIREALTYTLKQNTVSDKAKYRVRKYELK